MLHVINIIGDKKAFIQTQYFSFKVNNDVCQLLIPILNITEDCSGIGQNIKSIFFQQLIPFSISLCQNIFQADKITFSIRIRVAINTVLFYSFIFLENKIAWIYDKWILKNAIFYQYISKRIRVEEEIFKKHYYIHAKFYSKSFVKKIFAILLSQFAYNFMKVSINDISNQKWCQMTNEKMRKLYFNKTYQKLLKACNLTTLARKRILDKTK